MLFRVAEWPRSVVEDAGGGGQQVGHLLDTEAPDARVVLARAGGDLQGPPTQGSCRLEVAQPVPNEPAPGRVDAKPGDRLAEEPEPWLPAFTGPGNGREMRAVELQVEARALARELALHFAGDRLVVLLGHEPARDARLVGDDRHAPAEFVGTPHRRCRAGKEGDVIGPAHEVGVHDERAIAIQEKGGSQVLWRHLADTRAVEMVIVRLPSAAQRRHAQDQMTTTIPNASRSGKLLLMVLLAGVPVSLAAQDQRARLLAADRATADTVLQRGFVTGLLPGLAPDAVLLYPDAPVVRGTPHIRQFLQAQPALESSRATWQAQAAELSADSTLGATWGVGVVHTGDNRILLGRYIAAWHNGAGGWRLAALQLPGLGPQAVVRVPGMPLALPAMAVAGSVGPFVRADLDFARLAGDSGAGFAFERFAAPDAELANSSGVLVRGPQAIGALVMGAARWRWYPVAAGGADDGSLGWTVGQAVITAPTGEASHSKYLTIWRRTPAGIRYVTDGGSARPAAP